MKHFVKLAFAAVALTFSASAFAAPVSVAVTRALSPIDPLSPGDAAAVSCSHLLYMPLTALKDDLTYEPMLAEKTERLQPDLYRVTLRRGEWSDGQPVTAEDVLFSILRLADPELDTGLCRDLSLISGFDDDGKLQPGSKSGVEVKDGTVLFHLKKPVAETLFQDLILRWVPVVPEHIWSRYGARDYAVHLSELLQVVSGPMKLRDFNPDGGAYFLPNEHYMLGKPSIEGLSLRVLDGASVTAAFAAGEVDMNVPQFGALPDADYERLKAMPHLRTFEGGPNSAAMLFLNHTRLGDRRVRHGLSKALDREFLVQHVLGGRGEPVWTFFSSASPYQVKELKEEYNPQEAVRLLKEGNFDFGKPLRLVTSNGGGTLSSVVQILQAQLMQVGVKTTIETYDFPTVMSKAESGDYDLLTMSTSLSPLNPAQSLQFFVTKGNYNGYFNPRVDQLSTEMAQCPDDEALKAKAAELQHVLWEDMPMLCLYAPRPLLAVNKRLLQGGPKNFDSFYDIHLWKVAD